MGLAPPVGVPHTGVQRAAALQLMRGVRQQHFIRDLTMWRMLLAAVLASCPQSAYSQSSLPDGSESYVTPRLVGAAAVALRFFFQTNGVCVATVWCSPTSTRHTTGTRSLQIPDSLPTSLLDRWSEARGIRPRHQLLPVTLLRQLSDTFGIQLDTTNLGWSFPTADGRERRLTFQGPGFSRDSTVAAFDVVMACGMLCGYAGTVSVQLHPEGHWGVIDRTIEGRF
jgi:hypothetical protein